MSSVITAVKAWYEVGSIDSIPVLGARVIDREAGNIALFRTADNTVLALLDQCPHKAGPLSQGIVFGEQVSCPLHQWTISLRTGQAQEPDVGCTARFDTKVVNNQVYIFV
jgi:nitrite reductase (NADH) small subunit